MYTMCLGLLSPFVCIFCLCYQLADMADMHNKQDELKKVRNEYTKLKEVAKQTWAQAEELKKITLQALAVWEIMSDHVGGT
jgi:hypothetical protein